MLKYYRIAFVHEIYSLVKNEKIDFEQLDSSFNIDFLHKDYELNISYNHTLCTIEKKNQ